MQFHLSNLCTQLAWTEVELVELAADKIEEIGLVVAVAVEIAELEAEIEWLEDTVQMLAAAVVAVVAEEMRQL